MSLSFIGVTQRLSKEASCGEIRENLSLDWGSFFETHLGSFIPLPLCYKISINKYLDILGDGLKGIILSGGNDLSIFTDNELSEIRDEYELELLDYSLLHNIPVLGICRGAQIIAYKLGGLIKSVDNHVGTHKIITSDQKLYNVNSFHRYGIVELPGICKTYAKSSDNIIEAYSYKNLYAQMPHIERHDGINYLENWIPRNWKTLDAFDHGSS